MSLPRRWRRFRSEGVYDICMDGVESDGGSRGCFDSRELVSADVLVLIH